MVSYLIARKASDYLTPRKTSFRAVNQQMSETCKTASMVELASGIANEIYNPVAIMIEEAGWIQDLLEEESDLAGIKNFEELYRSLNQIHASRMWTLMP